MPASDPHPAQSSLLVRPNQARSLRVVGLLLALAWLGGSAPPATAQSQAAQSQAAQPQAGEPIVAAVDNLSAGHLAHIDAAGKIHVIARFFGSYPTAVTMARDNRNILCALGTAPCPLLEVTPAGVVTTVTHLGQPAQSLMLDETGRLLAVTGSTSTRLLAVDLDLRTVTTLLAIPDAGTAGAVHLGSGAIHLGRRSPAPAALFSFDPLTRTLTTLASSIAGTATGMAWDPASDGTLFTLSGPAGGVHLATPGGAVTTLFNLPYARALRVDDHDLLWVLVSQGTVNRIERRDRSGLVVRTHALTVIGGTTGFVLYADRSLHGRGIPRGGTTYDLHVALPGAAQGAFVLAASFAPRPGIRLADGRRIRLFPDHLLLLSLSGAYPGFRGFVAILDPNGEGRASVDLPLGLTGLRVFFAGIRLDPQAPAAVGEILNPVGITIR